MLQARKRNPNPNFLVWIFSGGVGVFRMKGWGPKSSVCPSKPGKSNFFGRISRDIPAVPEEFEKISLCSIFVPNDACMDAAISGPVSVCWRSLGSLSCAHLIFPKDPAVLKIIRRINSLSPYSFTICGDLL